MVRAALSSAPLSMSVELGSGHLGSLTSQAGPVLLFPPTPVLREPVQPSGRKFRVKSLDMFLEKSSFPTGETAYFSTKQGA